MKVLLINGSPHPDGCAAAALKELSGALNRHRIETETAHIGAKPIRGCIACGRCKNGRLRSTTTLPTGCWKKWSVATGW